MKLFELLLLFDNVQNTYLTSWKTQCLVCSELPIHQSFTFAHVCTYSNRTATKACFLPNFVESDCKTPGENTGGKNSHLVFHEKYSFGYLYTRTHAHTRFLLSCIQISDTALSRSPFVRPVRGRDAWAQGAGRGDVQGAPLHRSDRCGHS